MRLLLCAALCALALAAAACQAQPDEAGEEAAATPGTPEAVETGAEAPELGEGIAATVNGTEIPTEEVDSRLEAAVDDPEFADALDGEEGELLAAQFRAQTLSVLVQTRIVLDGAERMDAEPTDEDVEQTRTDLYEEFGGQEEFEDALASSGMSDDAFEEQLRSVAALDIVGRLLVERGEVPEPPEEAEEVDPEELALQNWLGEQFVEAEVEVDPVYGMWSPETGQVVPQEMMAPPADLGSEPPAGDS